ncbi:MAG: hypothetical protein C5B45_04005 [Chlamydiae bacterium]|nr:MAG: hypothetical protein C5B45_04005 [Chlamydiota bacterium]
MFFFFDQAVNVYPLYSYNDPLYSSILRASYPSTSFKKVSAFFRNTQTSLKNAFTSSEYKISCFTSKEISLDLTKRLKEFEQGIYYPYNDQNFYKIEHGKDNAKGYCGFFDSLNESGRSFLYIAECKKNKKVTKIIKGEKKIFFRKKKEIAAVSCCILRTLKTHNGNSIKAWYVCDLKVGENHRGEHLPTSLIKKAAWRFLQCRRGFGICMDEPDGRMSKSAQISMQHSLFSSLLKAKHFNQYRLNAKQVRDHHESIRRVFCENRCMKEKEVLRFVSNEGLKDSQLVDKKTGESRPIKLLHAKPGLRGQDMPQEGYDHAFSAVKGTPLDIYLQKIAKPFLTGHYIGFGMKEVDFNQITSAEI